MNKLGIFVRINKLTRYNTYFSAKYISMVNGGQLRYNNHDLLRKNINSIQKRCTKTDSLKCWKCGLNIRINVDFVCNECNALQKPHTTNYFSLFGIQENYNLNQKELRTKYRKLQSILHPDKFSNKSEEEKDISADYSSLINKAYNVLLAPLSRALYILSLHGETIAENNQTTDPEFLMEMMELNEEVENASKPDDLKKLNRKNMTRLGDLEKEISDHLSNQDLHKAKETIIKMKYYHSLKLFVNNKLRERGVVD